MNRSAILTSRFISLLKGPIMNLCKFGTLKWFQLLSGGRLLCVNAFSHHEKINPSNTTTVVKCLPPVKRIVHRTETLDRPTRLNYKFWLTNCACHHLKKLSKLKEALLTSSCAAIDQMVIS